MPERFECTTLAEKNAIKILFLPFPFVLFLSFYLFSSPNLSRRRLDVYHTCTHGVALKREFRMQV